MLKYLARPDLVPDGFTSNFVRYPTAALLYLPWLILGIRSRRLGRFWLAALLPTAINLGGQTLWATAPYYITPGLQAFLLRAATLWAILGAFILFRDERRLARSGKFWIGCLLTLAGFVLMSAWGLGAGSDVQITGVVIMFFCAICYGLYGVTVRYTMKSLHPLVVFSVISLYTSIGLIAMAPLGDPGSLVRLPPVPWFILVLSAVLGVAIAHGLYYIAVQRIGVAISSLTLAATPFVSLLGEGLYFGRWFSSGEWLGGLILLVGSTLALWSQQHLPPPAHGKPGREVAAKS